MLASEGLSRQQFGSYDIACYVPIYACITQYIIAPYKVFPDSHFGSFYPQSLVPDPQKLGARFRSDAYMTIENYIYLSMDSYFDVFLV